MKVFSVTTVSQTGQKNRAEKSCDTAWRINPVITEKELRKEINRIAELGTRKQIPIENGLVLDVLGPGRGTWRFRFRENGKSHKRSLGAYPLISLKEARGKRDELRLLMLKG